MDNFTTFPAESQQQQQTQQMQQPQQPQHSSPVQRRLLLPHLTPQLLKAGISVFGFILITASVSTAFYFYNQYKTTQKMLKNPSQATSIETKSLVKKVSDLMDLPNEVPQLATVVDRTKLANQPFFAHSQNGDKVLLYTQNKKAVLYRPSVNKIIEVAPINVPNSAPPAEQGHVAGASTQAAPIPTTAK